MRNWFSSWEQNCHSQASLTYFLILQFLYLQSRNEIKLRLLFFFSFAAKKTPGLDLWDRKQHLEFLVVSLANICPAPLVYKSPCPPPPAGLWVWTRRPPPPRVYRASDGGPAGAGEQMIGRGGLRQEKGLPQECSGGGGAVVKKRGLEPDSDAQVGWWKLAMGVWVLSALQLKRMKIPVLPLCQVGQGEHHVTSSFLGSLGRRESCFILFEG